MTKLIEQIRAEYAREIPAHNVSERLDRLDRVNALILAENVDREDPTPATPGDTIPAA